MKHSFQKEKSDGGDVDVMCTESRKGPAKSDEVSFVPRYSRLHAFSNIFRGKCELHYDGSAILEIQ